MAWKASGWRSVSLFSFTDDLDNFDFVIFVRNGVTEMLELLSEFCNLYVYSHGLKSYIMQILQLLDPDNKYFLDRENRVLAP